MIEILTLINTGVSFILTLLCVWGLFAFFPRKADRGDSGPAWLILAIWLGFASTAANAFYWRVFGDMALRYDLITVYQLRYFGNTYGDTVWKGLMAVAVYLHFYARWKSIPAEEQKHWRPLLMGFYPNTKALAYRVLMRRLRSDREANAER